MNNKDAESYIKSCQRDFYNLTAQIEKLGHTSQLISYLTNYSIVRACGTIENCFKTIITDIHSTPSKQISNYLENTIKNSSMNPSYNNICGTLKKFDTDWNKRFKEKVLKHTNCSRLQDSIASLNSARNSFAHGGTPSVSFESIKKYFDDAIIILNILEEIVRTEATDKS